MMRVIVRVFAVVGFLVVLLIGGAVAMAIAFSPSKPDLPKSIVLEMDFEKELSETLDRGPFPGLFGGKSSGLRDVVDALDRAGRDDRVKGMVARVGNSTLPVGATQELRDAILRFRKSGRFAVVHAETFGEFSNGTQSYFLASAFDEVWLQPQGHLGITGFLAQPQTYRGVLEKLRIEPQFDKRYEYKSAAETFMERSPTGPARANLEDLLGDLYSQVVGAIAEGRNLPPDTVRSAIDRAPLLDKEALAAKFIDRLGYYDEVIEAAKQRAGKPDAKAQTIDLAKYGKAAGPAHDQGPTVALIVGDGVVTRGTGDVDPLSGERGFGGRDVAAAFRKAIDDNSVKAILFRVNTPGGSPTGSELVRREVIRARQSGKPVIVSMGSVAASGGYWVAMSADKIVALPGSFTGSIGVLSGKFDMTGARDWIGVGQATIARGNNAGIWAQGPYSEAERARMTLILDDIYANFVAGVAEGRKLPVDKVREIAKGRVWTGRQAQELGLVDAVGGYAEALELVRAAIGLAPGAPVTLLPYPKPKNSFQQVADLVGGETRLELGRMLMADALSEYRPLMQSMSPLVRAALKPEETMLMMPPLGIAGN